MTNAQENNKNRQEIARMRMDQANARRVNAMLGSEEDWDKANAVLQAAAAEWKEAVREAVENNW